jgi:hypothetical protein
MRTVVITGASRGLGLADATALAIMARLLPAWLIHKIIRLAMRLPNNGELRAAS